jgi:hypothetical protein
MHVRLNHLTKENNPLGLILYENIFKDREFSGWIEEPFGSTPNVK